MKFILLMLLASVALATPTNPTMQSIDIEASGGSPVPIAYDHTNSQSLVFPSVAYGRTVGFINHLGARACIEIQTGTSTVEPSGTNTEICLGDGEAIYDDKVQITSAVYLRMKSAPATSGYATIITRGG